MPHQPKSTTTLPVVVSSGQWVVLAHHISALRCPAMRYLWSASDLGALYR